MRAVFHEILCRHRLDRRPRRIAANLVLDTRQRLHRNHAGELRPAIELRPEPAIADGPDLGALWSASLLRSAIDRLPGSPASRAVSAEAAYRAWILDQPRAVIAGQLGLERAAVDTRLHRLRRVIRRELDRAA